MSYQRDDEEHLMITTKEVDVPSSFFSSTNRLRAAVLFFMGIVAVTFLVRLDEFGAVVMHPSILALSKQMKSSSKGSKAAAKEFFESWGTNSRLAPMQYHTFSKKIGYFKTFLAKYQLLDDRELPDGYEFPTEQTNGKGGMQGTYVYAVVSSGSNCDGPIFSVSGISVGTCQVSEDTEDEGYSSYELDCDSGMVTVMLYSDKICNEQVEPVPRAIGTYGSDTCTSSTSKTWKEAANAPFKDTSKEFSVVKYCTKDSPVDLKGSVVFQYFSGTSKRTAAQECSSSSDNTCSAEFFEAFPSGSCIPADVFRYNYYDDESDTVDPISDDDDAFASGSYEFGYQPAESSLPFLHIYLKSEDCDVTEATSRWTVEAPDTCYSEDDSGKYMSKVEYFTD